MATGVQAQTTCTAGFGTFGVPGNIRYTASSTLTLINGFNKEIVNASAAVVILRPDTNPNNPVNPNNPLDWIALNNGGLGFITYAPNLRSVSGSVERATPFPPGAKVKWSYKLRPSGGTVVDPTPFTVLSP